jgi:hypothetical protein
MAGEIFGCALAKRSYSSSFVGVHLFDADLGADVVKFGQVQFYFTHSFHDVQHYFAVIKYINTTARPAGVVTAAAHASRKAKLKATFQVRGVASKNIDASVKEELQRITNAEILHESHNQLLSNSFEPSGKRNIVPVHRLAFRFIPAVIGDTIVPCRCPSKTHA